MTWEIFLGIGVLVSFVGTFTGVCVKMVVPLTKSIVELTNEVKQLRKDYDLFDTKRRVEHKALWDHNEEQDKTLENHAQRLHDLDGKW